MSAGFLRFQDLPPTGLHFASATLILSSIYAESES